ncbi:MAG: hypothetical protein HYR96_06815 [Deltaproteobacteria bacterium]|nr:hypothetical protein [Deltaproteobacteria bacterium]MBI3294174.1 hypothetical protein [Deltaproteobacteria bacterium]
MNKKVTAVITDVLGDRVVVLTEALGHTMARHFPLFPEEIVLELVERVLRDPSEVFQEQKKHLFHLFYRFDSLHYLLVTVRRKHKNLKKVHYAKS